VTRLCGKRYERQPSREHTRYGRQRGVATLAGQKLRIERPRVRKAHGGGEVPLETYARLQSDDAMPQAVLRRMVRGVSTRDYEEVIDTAREGFGVARSCFSCGFVRASAANVRALAERQFVGEHFGAILIDGVEYAGGRGLGEVRPIKALGCDSERNDEPRVGLKSPTYDQPRS
jgi:putative transposase